MYDLKSIRDNPQAFDAGLARRGVASRSEEILAQDTAWRAMQTEVQGLLSRRNELSRQIGDAKRQGRDAVELMDEVARIKEDLPQLEVREKQLGEELTALLSTLPNAPAADTPDGPDEEHNVEMRRWGTPRQFDFAPKEHDALGEGLGLMDFAGAAKLSGARFVVLKGALARLERAIAQFMLDLQTGEHGYQEVSPPTLVKDTALFGTGQLPKFGEDLFHTTDDYWLIPTAEVPLTNLVADEILAAESLPLRMAALTLCYRSEAGSAGKDTRGMIRQHQFWKVEMVSITAPEQSAEEHERMTNCAEVVLQRLGLPYRVMALCCGDMGFCATKTYDLEVWLPGQDRYREISSCSNCGDFQARRMKARMRAEKGTRFVHTLNGSGLAVGRTLVAVLENYQQADGSVVIPEALRPYMGGMEVLR